MSQSEMGEESIKGENCPIFTDKLAGFCKMKF